MPIRYFALHANRLLLGYLTNIKKVMWDESEIFIRTMHVQVKLFKTALPVVFAISTIKYKFRNSLHKINRKIEYFLKLQQVGIKFVYYSYKSYIFK